MDINLTHEYIFLMIYQKVKLNKVRKRIRIRNRKNELDKIRQIFLSKVDHHLKNG